MSQQKIFRLSAEETEYLCRLMLEDRYLAAIICQDREVPQDLTTIDLDHDHAELLRDYFTERLARVGFREDYQPNHEGQLLEKLIDVFFRIDW